MRRKCLFSLLGILFIHSLYISSAYSQSPAAYEKLKQENERLAEELKELKKQLSINKSNEGALEDLTLQKNSLLNQMVNVRQEKVALTEEVKDLKDRLNYWENNFDAEFENVIEPFQNKIKEFEKELEALNKAGSQTTEKQPKIVKQILPDVKNDIREQQEQIKFLEKKISNL